MNQLPNQPTRTAVQDGNAGYVSAPSIKHTAHKQAYVNKQMTGDDLNVQKISQGLGNAFSSYIKEEVSNLKEQQKLSGVAKAGMKKSMDEVDVDVKQTKFTDFIFGEDIEYRAAQQAVITNGVEAQYRNELANIDQYAGYTEREFGEVLKGSLDVIADRHKNDPETKQLATDAWITASGKLVDKHHKTHFAYKQTQMRQIAHDTTMGRIDQMNIEEGEVSSPEDVRLYNMAWDSILSPDVRPTGMTRVAKSTQIFDIINETLEAGTITAYKQAAIRNQWEGASPEQIAKREGAIKKYDTKFGYKVNTTIEETVAALESVSDLDVAEEMVKNLFGAVDQHETRQTGSVRSKDIIAEARSRISKLLPDLYKRTGRNGKRIKDVEGARKALRKKEYTYGVETHPYSKAIKEEASDLNFVEDVEGLTGTEEGGLTGQQAAEMLLTDTAVGAMYVPKFREGKEVVPILKSGLKAMIDGISSMQDPDTGMPTDRWKKGMTFMNQLKEANPDRFAKTLGDQYSTFEIYADATRAGIPINEMKTLNDNLVTAIAKGDAGVTYTVPDGMTQRSHVLEKMGLSNLNTQSGSKIMEQWKKGMATYGQDFDLAIDYTKKMYNRDSAILPGGILVQNVGALQANLKGSDLEGIFQYINNDPRLGKDLVRGIIGDTTAPPSYRGFWGSLFGDDRENTVPTQSNQIKGLSVEVAMDGDGVWLKAPNGRDRRLSSAYLEAVASRIEADEEKRKIEEDRRSLARLAADRKRAETREALFGGLKRSSILAPSTPDQNLTAGN